MSKKSDREEAEQAEKEKAERAAARAAERAADKAEAADPGAAPVRCRITHKGARGDEPLTLVINGHDKHTLQHPGEFEAVPARFVDLAQHSPDSFDVELG